jgi:hypothetical protein
MGVDEFHFRVLIAVRQKRSGSPRRARSSVGAKWGQRGLARRWVAVDLAGRFGFAFLHE